ncbi:MAG TPA: ATP-binding protein [Acidimicrobiales bacterium]|nr:ATP-binding protein [Acidimicrobiales bacterium]
MDLAPVPSSAFAARDVVESLLGHAGDRGSTVALVTTELVTNAIVHAGTPVRLSISVSGDGLDVLVEVADAAPGPLRQFPGRPRSRYYTRGRGLEMLARLALEWGVRQEEAGKTVWARIAL